MVHCKIFSVKAFLVIAILVSDIHTYKVKGTLPDLSTIIGFFQNILRHNSNTTLNASPTFRTEKVPKIQKIIDNKVRELKAFLQDDDALSFEADNESGSNITLDGDDETTIVEFLPPTGENNKFRNKAQKQTDLLKSNIEKYKKMRKKIKMALENELVSEKTQDMVTKTLDSMIAELIENKCSWNGAHNGTAEGRKTSLIARRWNKQWLQFKKHYLRAARSNNDIGQPGLKLFKFFEQFHDFLSHVVEDTEKISDRYKIVCQFIDRNEGGQKTLRKGIVNCRSFKLCSDELRVFFKDVYEAVNNTGVSAFRNYASMYIRDVNTAQSDEKESVVNTVNEIGDLVEHRIESIFINITQKLKLDKDKVQQKNIKIIKRYINKIIDNSINDIKNNLGEDLRPLGEKLQIYITQDLSVNVDLDLNNLKADLKGNLCERFSTCNGKIDGKFDTRRQNTGSMLGDYNRNSVYVKVQLNLDDEIKDKLISGLARESRTTSDVPETQKSKHKKHKGHKNKKSKSKDKLTKDKSTKTIIEPDYRKKFDASVTRTTLQISTTPNVTSLKNVNSTTTMLTTTSPTTISPTTTTKLVTTTITTAATTVTGNVLNKTQPI